MRIFYTASYAGKKDYQKYYDLVLSAIRQNQIDLISPETNNYRSLLLQKEIKKLKSDREIHYQAIKKGILWADAVIIEISREDFQLGHEATLAAQNKKPVLCLSINEDYSLKIRYPFFHAAKYNPASIDEIVSAFILRSRRELLSRRFNCFLSPAQLHHLSKKALEEDTTRSNYLRSLIDRDIKA